MTGFLNIHNGKKKTLIFLVSKILLSITFLCLSQTMV